MERKNKQLEGTTRPKDRKKQREKKRIKLMTAEKKSSKMNKGEKKGKMKGDKMAKVESEEENWKLRDLRCSAWPYRFGLSVLPYKQLHLNHTARSASNYSQLPSVYLACSF